MKTILQVSFLTTVFALPFNSSAVYTIGDAMVDATVHNQKLLLNKDNLDIAKVQHPKVMSEFWPVASVTASSKKQKTEPYTTQQFFAPGTSRDVTIPSKTITYYPYSISINQEIYHGGKSIAKLAAVKNQINAAEKKFNIDNSESIIRIIDAYYGLILKRKIYEIRVKGEESMRVRLNQVETRFNSGEITRTDVSRAKASLAGATTAKESAFGDMKAAEAVFDYSIGVSPSDELSDVSLDQMKIDLPKNLEEFSNLVMINNLEIAYQKENLSSARHMIAVSKADLMPVISASITQNKGNDPILTNIPNGTTYSMDLQMPIFNTSIYASIKEAKYKARAAETTLNDMTGNVQQMISDIWSKYQSLVYQSASVQEAVNASQDALEGISQEYKIGSKTTLDLLVAEDDFLNTLISEAKVKKDLIMAAFSMKQLMGNLHSFDFKSL